MSPPKDAAEPQGQNNNRLEQEPGAMSDAVIIEASLIARRKGKWSTTS
jgi:hypothetical protein